MTWNLFAQTWTLAVRELEISADLTRLASREVMFTADCVQKPRKLRFPIKPFPNKQTISVRQALAVICSL
jgi:hypothetical protein